MGALRGFRTRLAHVDSRMACVVVVVVVLFFSINVYPTIVWSADRQSPVCWLWPMKVPCDPTQVLPGYFKRCVFIIHPAKAERGGRASALARST